MKEGLKQEILKNIFEHYWWNIRGFSYRCNNSEDLEKEMLALALEPFLEGKIRKPQSKVKINVLKKLKDEKVGEKW